MTRFFFVLSHVIFTVIFLSFFPFVRVKHVLQWFFFWWTIIMLERFLFPNYLNWCIECSASFMCVWPCKYTFFSFKKKNFNLLTCSTTREKSFSATWKKDLFSFVKKRGPVWFFFADRLYMFLFLFEDIQDSKTSAFECVCIWLMINVFVCD